VARPLLPSAAAIGPYLERIDAQRWYSNFGPLQEELEARLAERHGPGVHVVAAANATLILALALRAMDLPQGALCILPSWTFVATAHAVMMAGLRPWFLDADADSWTLDPEATAEALGRAPGPVAAVIPVAAFGRPMDLDAWRAFRHRTGVPVLVDAAAAFDAAACPAMQGADLPIAVSLHATKTLGVGEGGYLATEDKALADRLRQITSFGFRGSREAMLPAANAKLSEYTAAVGLAAMDAWPDTRRRWLRTSQLLRIALSPLAEIGFQPGWGLEWVSSVCVVRLPDGSADAVEAALGRVGVPTRRWWGDGCHTSRAFAGELRDPLPVTARLAGSTLGLPFAIDLSPEEIDRVAAALTS
jgi:dTDP-4-amino-4,6-dideoxygalactose transaminase